MGYRPWFDIVCQHGYFSDRLCRPLSVAPTADCQRLLQRYRLRFRAVPGGGQVHYDPDDPLQLLAYFDETLPFTFTILNTDPALLSYTADVPAALPDRAPGLYYFDNLTGA